MIETRVIRHFPGGVELFHYNHATDETTFETKYDAEPVKEQNAMDRRELPGNWRGDMHLVARIPMTLFMQLQQTGITRDQKAFSKWLNDRDNQIFRVKQGLV
jgi:hypothetical protein